MRILLPAVSLALTGCLAGEPLRYVVEPAAVASSERVRVTARTVSIVEVSLPEYAKDTKLFVEADENALQALRRADWGEEPERAFANTLVRELTQITGAQVATDPWPLGGVPDAEVRVRVSHMVVGNDGTVSLAGHFSVRRDEAVERNRVELFSLRTPSGVAESASPADVVRAHAAAWRELAAVISRTL